MLGGLLLIGGIGWFAMTVAAIAIFSAAAWLVAVVVLIISIFSLKNAYEAAKKRGDQAHMFDIVAAPLLGSAVGYAIAYLFPIGMSGPIPPVLKILEAILGFHAFLFGWLPFVLVSDTYRDKRVLAYFSFAAASYVYVLIFLVAGLKLT